MKKRVLSTLSLLLALSACGGPAVQTSDPAQTVPGPSPSPSSSAVWTDWSRLEEPEPPALLYRRWYEEQVHSLIPLEGGYGTLVPFVGSFPPDLSWGGVYQYGLMTMDGTIVVDTTYASAGRLTYYDGSTGETTPLPVLSLMESDYAYDEEYGYSYGIRRFGAAALDGSWALPVEYDGVGAISPDRFLVWREDTAYAYDLSGALLYTVDCLGAAEELDSYEGLNNDCLSEGVLVLHAEDGALRLIDLFTGDHVLLTGIKAVGHPGGGLIPAQTREGLWGCVDKTGRWVIPAQYASVYASVLGMEATTDDGQTLWFNSRGEEIPAPDWDSFVQETPAPPVPNAWDFQDSYTGVTYFQSYTGDGYDILDGEGNLLTHIRTINDAGTQNQAVINGLVLVVDDLTAGYKDLDGNWVFRILLAEAGED